MKEVVEFIARSLVDEKDAVRVEEVPARDRTLHLELHVAPGDLGKVIGRQGRTARAIRTVLSAASAKSGRHASLDIAE
jgi:hypothetical protein